jgi:hypothetical protein
MERRTLIDHNRIDNVVERMRGRGINAYWDGWTVVVHKPSHKAFTDKRGTFVDGKWGYMRKFRPRRDGNWAIPNRYV